VKILLIGALLAAAAGGVATFLKKRKGAAG
jgi:hypothetical protein